MEKGVEKHFTFGAFHLDVEQECLWHRKQIVKLTLKAFAVLRYLAERPGRLITKEELFGAVWPKTVVADVALATCIWELRRALGDSPRKPQFIETAYRRGYRFIGSVTRSQNPVGSRQGEVSGWERETRPFPSLTSNLKPLVSNLVGREAELTQLYHWFEKALHGERQIVFVSGEPGIGKTTLVDAFLQSLESSIQGLAPESRGLQSSEVQTLTPEHHILNTRPWVARGQCIAHYGAAEPYLPVLDAWSRLCREPGHERLVTHLNHYAPLWLAQIPSLLSPADRKSLQRELTGASRERMLREITDALEALTREVPLILVLEDLHWSDFATLDLLSFLARRREPACLLVIGTHRPIETHPQGQSLEEVKRELQIHQHGQHLSLPLLTVEATGQYLQRRFPHNAFPASFPRWMNRHTSGNPLFLVNVSEHLVARNIIRQHDGQWVLAPDFESIQIDIPMDVQAVIDQQSAQISSQEAQVLQAASVAGMEFSTAAVAAALHSDVSEIETCCERLTRQNLFLCSCGLSEWPDKTTAGRYGFLHVLYQQAWYKRVSPAKCVQWHRAIGARQETAYGERAHEVAAELAMHFEQGRDYHQAIQYLRLAAENASWRGAYPEARAHLAKGLELLKALSDLPEQKKQELVLQTGLGLCIQAYKGLAAPEAESAYIRAQELCRQVGEPVQLFRLLRGLSTIYQVRGELWRAHELAEQCLRLAEQRQDSVLLMSAHAQLGVVSTFLGQLLPARTHFEQGIALYDPQHSPPLLGEKPSATTYEAIGCLSFEGLVLLGLGYPDQAIKKTQEALTLAQEQPHPFSLTWTAYRAAEIHLARQEWHLAQEQAERVINVATQHELMQWGTMGIMLRGAAIVAQGQVEEGMSQIRQGLTAYQATGAEAGRPYYLALLARAYGKAGQPDAGLTVLEEALAAARKCGAYLQEASLWWLKGELMLQSQGSVRQRKASQHNTENPIVEVDSEACFRTAIEVARSRSAKMLELHASVSLCRLWQQQGKKDEAHQLLAEIYGWFTEGFDVKGLQEAKALLKELH